MTPLTIITELGPDVDLLTRPDEWLDNHRRSLAAQASRLLEELDSVMKAQRIKRKLQQSNQVPVMLPHRDGDGNIGGIALHIMPLTEATQALDNPVDDTGRANRAAHHAAWTRDGYDPDAASRLRRLQP